MAYFRPLVASLALLSIAIPSAVASQMTVDLAHPGAPLKKGGLGTLFGITTIAGGPAPTLIENTIYNTTASQGRAADNGSNPYSTDSIAPLIRGKNIRLMCRLNDLLPGFPYGWNGLANWDQQVTTAIEDITANYADVVYGIEVLNEPDAQLNNSAFNSDPAVQGSTYNDRINWLWQHTVKEIRTINPALKVMGPNYLSYLPQNNATDQPKMQAFLENAIATGTSPDIIGWHSLLTNEPSDIGKSLTFYRELEQQLGVPNAPLPISIDEYGVNDGTFEGVPGHVVQYWAEMERDKIDFGGEGVYTNYSQLGNTLRYPWQTEESSLAPNGGWYMLRWYSLMAGQSVPVSPASARYDHAYDGVASWDPASRAVTVLLGGSDDDADIQFAGLGKLGLGSTVRVKVEAAVWSVDPYQGDTTLERGGDPLAAPLTILDETLPINGNFTVPIHKIDHANGYRIQILPAGPEDPSTTKYEAEDAYLRAVKVQGTARLASNRSYVSAINKPDSSVTFHVQAPARGIYLVYLRYANATGSDATQPLKVNNVSVGDVEYPATNGGPTSEFAFTTRRVAMQAGDNTLALAKGTGAISLDYIDVRPDTHRYQAPYAFIGDATARSFYEEYILPDFVGAINNYDSYVEFNIDAPATGSYNLNLAYADGIAGQNAIFNLYVNTSGQGSVNLPPTGGWLGDPHDPRIYEKQANIPVVLNQGRNTVRLQKSDGYAELDFVTLSLP